MKHRRLGRSGVQISELALGTMNFGMATDEAESSRIISAALDGGIDVIDTAAVYADGTSEEIVGRAIASRRSEVFLTSKVFPIRRDNIRDAGNSPHRIIAECEASLKRLGTDYLDLYFLHRSDWDVPQEETLKALDRLVRDGKVRYVGCSTHPPWRTVEALHIADRLGLPKFVCEQPPYNLVDRQVENEIVPMCQAYDMGILAWSPLAQGTLAGRYKKASGYAAGSRPTKKDVFAERVTDAGIAVAQRTAEIAAQRGVPLPAFAVAWVLHQPAVTSVILGPRTVEHLEGVLGAGEIELSPDELSACDHLVPPGNFVADHFNTARWRPEAQRG